MTLSQDQKPNVLTLGKYLQLALDENNIPRQYADGRPYRYDISGIDPLTAFMLYPFGPSGHDRVIEEVMKLVTSGKPIDPEKIKGLQMRVGRADEIYETIQIKQEAIGILKTSKKSGLEAGLKKLEQEVHDLTEKLKQESKKK